MTQSDARIQAEAEAFGEAHPDETSEERAARLAAEAEDRLRQVNADVAARAGAATTSTDRG